MADTRATYVQRASGPMSYDIGSGEGRQASPSNPSGASQSNASEARSETFVFRCTPAEKAQLRDKAARAGVSAALLMREALGLVDANRRKAPPKADPELIRAIGRVGNNLNQLTRWINRSVAAGQARDIDALKVLGQIVMIEHQLALIVSRHKETGST